MVFGGFELNVCYIELVCLNVNEANKIWNRLLHLYLSDFHIERHHHSPFCMKYPTHLKASNNPIIQGYKSGQPIWYMYSHMLSRIERFAFYFLNLLKETRVHI